METAVDKYLKAKMSLDELEIQDPPMCLVEEARKKVLARKPIIERPVKKSFVNFFCFEIKAYYAAFAALLIMIGVVYFSQKKCSNESTHNENKNKKEVPIGTSTVLASLTQHNNSKTSVNSSTVLTSIITFIAKN